MLQVCRCNSTSASGSNSSFVNFMNSESSIVSHMELTLFKTTCDYKTLKKTVFIFVGYEYAFTFYDLSTSKLMNVTGRVDAINGGNSDQSTQSLTVTYLNKSSCNEDDADISVTRGPVCGCMNKADPDKYNTTVTTTIPISNITDVCYTGGSNPINSDKPPKEGVEVVLLGISAEMIRAVVINLKMIDDNADNAVKDIFMKVGGIYNIAYFDPEEKAMFEIQGKLLAINETENNVNNNCSVVREVNEQCGLNNSIYNAGCNCENCNTDKDDYMNSETIEKEVLLTMDCSMDFSGHYHTVKLSTIRDCTVIDESGVDLGPSDSCGCDCNSSITLQSGTTKVNIDTKSGIVNYSGSQGCNNFGTISLQELVDYYFGN